MEVLDPYRRRIDEFDGRIVELIAQRMGVIREVAAVKRREGIPAVLPDRVEAVIVRAAANAAARNVDPATLGRVYTELVGYSCRLEDELIEAGRDAAATGRVAGKRPQLIPNLW